MNYDEIQKALSIINSAHLSSSENLKMCGKILYWVRVENGKEKEKIEITKIILCEIKGLINSNDWMGIDEDYRGLAMAYVLNLLDNPISAVRTVAAEFIVEIVKDYPIRTHSSSYWQCIMGLKDEKS